MKYFYVIIISVVLLISSAINVSATTYLWFWVNGDTSHVLTQGDTLAWEMNVANLGNTVTIELYLDLDASKNITSGDLLLEQLEMTDGESGQDGPTDSSTTPDGLLYVYFGPFGFAPQNYIMKVIDEDESSVARWFTLNELSNPPALISGKVYIEGTSAPDPLYENIMVGAMGQHGLFSGLTDSNGEYQINLHIADEDWDVGTLFDRALTGYIEADEWHELTAPAGETDSINFYYAMPKAWIYGDLLDQDGMLISKDGYVGLENRTTGYDSHGILDKGHFIVPAVVEIQGNDSTNYFQLRVQDELLIPDYMIPYHGDDFPITFGDSVEKNIIAFATDSMIYGYVTENSGPPSKIYEVSANADSFGYTDSESDVETGYFVLHIRGGSPYNVGIQDDPEWGTPPPPGMILEQGNWRMVMPGDTVYFNFIPAHSALQGMISFDPGDPVDFDYEHNRVTAWDSSYTNTYGTRVDESNTFFLPVLDGKYHVNIEPEENNYLVMPGEYQNISVVQDTVDTLNFLLNYGHATLIVKFNGAPLSSYYDGYWISTEGEWPEIYSTWREILPDSSVHFNICEGTWHLSAPQFDQYYEVTPQETSLVVTEQDSSFYIEFVYKDPTGINKAEVLPQSMYLRQNYPNPFNPETRIEYGLPKASEVRLTIYNILGQTVAELVNKSQNAGRYTITWRPENIASGLYIYRLEAGDTVKTRKLLFMK